MAKKKLAMGRGLGAILTETAEAYEQSLSDNSSLVLDLDIDIIKPNPYQPRKTFNHQHRKNFQNLSKSTDYSNLLLSMTMVMEIIFLLQERGDFVLQNLRG